MGLTVSLVQMSQRETWVPLWGRQSPAVREMGGSKVSDRKSLSSPARWLKAPLFSCLIVNGTVAWNAKLQIISLRFVFHYAFDNSRLADVFHVKLQSCLFSPVSCNLWKRLFEFTCVTRWTPLPPNINTVWNICHVQYDLIVGGMFLLQIYSKRLRLGSVFWKP